MGSKHLPTDTHHCTLPFTFPLAHSASNLYTAAKHSWSQQISKNKIHPCLCNIFFPLRKAVKAVMKHCIGNKTHFMASSVSQCYTLHTWFLLAHKLWGHLVVVMVVVGGIVLCLYKVQKCIFILWELWFLSFFLYEFGYYFTKREQKSYELQTDFSLNFQTWVMAKANFISI